MPIRITEAFSRWTYEKVENGNVLVTDTEGRTGIFTAAGVWVAGEITHASLHVIGFVGARHVRRDPGLPDPGTRFARSGD